MRGVPLTKLHVPAVAAETLQNWQAPWHALLQHTPSAQNVLEHSWFIAQVWPLAFLGVQVPELQ